MFPMFPEADVNTGGRTLLTTYELDFYVVCDHTAEVLVDYEVADEQGSSGSLVTRRMGWVSRGLEFHYRRE